MPVITGGSPPNVRASFRMPFPASVSGAGPIQVTKNNGIWTVSFSMAGLAIQNPPQLSALPTDYVLVYDSIAQVFTQVPMSAFLANVTVLQFIARGVNFNSANTDTPIPLLLPPGARRYTVNGITVENASVVMATATIGVFTQPGGAGSVLAANQATAISSIADDTAGNTQVLTLTPGGTQAFVDNPVYARIGTAQGAPATADVAFRIVAQ